MIYDCHLHTCFSGDSDTPVRQQVQRAITLGMEEMCITDHHDYDSCFCEDNFELDIPAYLPALRQIQEEYKGSIRINIGIELGLQNHIAEYLRQFSENYGSSFDYVIGSSHFVDRTDPYYPEYWESHGEKEGLEKFFQVSLERVQKLYWAFDSYGHLDYVVRYAPHGEQYYSYKEYIQWIDPLLKVLIQHGKALECNTGAFKYGMSQPNPCTDILKRYHELGGELITVGSDAHTPEYIGSGFDRCREMLLTCGFRYYTVFRGRKACMIPL